jgi:hypothetical protein
MARAGLAAEVQGGAQTGRRQARGTPSERCGQLGDAFSEQRAATPAHPADKPADAVAATRHISQRPLVLRVSAFGASPTQRAPRPAALQADLQMDRGSLAPEASTRNPVHCGNSRLASIMVTPFP